MQDLSFTWQRIDPLLAVGSINSSRPPAAGGNNNIYAAAGGVATKEVVIWQMCTMN